MNPEVTTLNNGLRVVTQTMSHLQTTSLGMWVGVGARHERPEQHGLSHLLEHMAFKGTATRTTRDIAEQIETVGGELNAATGLETTAYFARVLKGDEPLALELIADILLNSAFREDELEKEREVILQEIAGTLDSPDDIVFDLIQDAAYPAQAAGRSILGTPASVKAISAGDLKGFLVAHYRPGNMVLAAAGAVHHAAIVRHAEALFGRLSDGNSEGEEPAQYRGGVRSSARRFEQSHLVVGFEGPSYRQKDFFAVQVFSGLFGGGMSSRLFQEVRERRGLCYSIYSSAWGLKDSGMFAVHAATGPGMMNELIDVVGAELERMGAEGPADAEVARAKAQLKAGLMMSLESSSSRAEQMARQLLTHKRLLTASELIETVDRVTAGDVRAVARSLRNRAPSVAVVGAGPKSRQFAARAGERLSH
jgi:predicted Zn-dependent peptidase